MTLALAHFALMVVAHKDRRERTTTTCYTTVGKGPENRHGPLEIIMMMLIMLIIAITIVWMIKLMLLTMTMMKMCAATVIVMMIGYG